MALACLTDHCASDGDCVQLTEREYTVCEAICSSELPVSFGKLKEATNFHQEIVSRVVRRLMLHGLVSKVEGKYHGRYGSMITPFASASGEANRMASACCCRCCGCGPINTES